MSALAPPQLGGATAGTRLLRACARLRGLGILAVGEAAGDPAATRQRLSDALVARFPAASGALLFWPEEGAVDDRGHLVRPVTVHCSDPGVVRAARAALAEQGLTAVEGPDPLTLCVAP